MENQSFLPDEYDSSFLHQALRFETEVGLALLQVLANDRVSLPAHVLRAKRAGNLTQNHDLRDLLEDLLYTT